jgi:hypothetical protein
MAAWLVRLAPWHNLLQPKKHQYTATDNAKSRSMWHMAAWLVWLAPWHNLLQPNRYQLVFGFFDYYLLLKK